MKGVTFYREPDGTSLAVFREQGATTHSAVGYRSGCYSTTTVSNTYLRARCTRVCEDIAREDVALFDLLDDDTGAHE